MKKIDKRVIETAEIFREAGKQVYLVGGAVRDLLRNKDAHDWDLATDARPEEVIAACKKRGLRVIPTGIKHGTVTVHFKGGEFEVTAFRTEGDYRDGRHPGTVVFAAGIEEDLSRRDFTMNAAAIALPGGELVDPFGGVADIQAGVIRCVGNPQERFREDGLRPMRAVRFASQLGFTLDGDTLRAIRPALDITAKVSAERIRDETDKILASPKPSTAFRLMEETGLLDLVLPELAACRGIEQKGYHVFDVLDHSLAACDFASAKDFPPAVRVAALLHDTGKPRTRRRGEDGVWTFYRHEAESARISRQVLSRLRYPNVFIDEVENLIACHMFHYTEDWSDAAVRRFIIRVGKNNLENLYALRLADAGAMTGKEVSPFSLAPLTGRVEKILAQGNAFTLKDLAVKGGDLIANGIPPGRHLGIILGELLETALDDPALNTREKLLEIAKNSFFRRNSP